MSRGWQQLHRLARELGQFRRHYRYTDAVRAHRVERRIGRYLTDQELERWQRQWFDKLDSREQWLRLGGRLVIENGKLSLSRDLPNRRTPQ